MTLHAPSEGLQALGGWIGAALGERAWSDPLSLSLLHGRARALALVESAEGRSPQLIGASLGAPFVFTSLCVALAEAPLGTSARKMRDAGWLAWSRFELAPDRSCTLFALYDNVEDGAELALLAAIAERCARVRLIGRSGRSLSEPLAL